MWQDSDQKEIVWQIWCQGWEPMLTFLPQPLNSWKPGRGSTPSLLFLLIPYDSYHSLKWALQGRIESKYHLYSRMWSIGWHSIIISFICFQDLQSKQVNIIQRRCDIELFNSILSHILFRLDEFDKFGMLRWTASMLQFAVSLKLQHIGILQ